MGVADEWPDYKAPDGALLKEDLLAERLDMHKTNTDWGPLTFQPKFLNIQALPPPLPHPPGVALCSHIGLSIAPTSCCCTVQRCCNPHSGLTCSEHRTLVTSGRGDLVITQAQVGVALHGCRRAVLLCAGPHAAHQQPGEVGQQDQCRPDQEGLGARSGQAGRHPGAGGPSAPRGRLPGRCPAWSRCFC